MGMAPLGGLAMGFLPGEVEGSGLTIVRKKTNMPQMQLGSDSNLQI
jgi:acetate kinase